MKPGFLLWLLASSVLFILSFPHPDMGALAFLALVPLIAQLSRSGIRRAFFAGWGTGTIWFFVSYNWVSHSMTVYGNIPFPLAECAVLILAGIHGLYLGLFTLLIPVVVSQPGTEVRRYGGLAEKADLTTPIPQYPHTPPILGHPLIPLLVLPSAWVLLEYVRSWFPAPFPWLILGTAAWKIPFAGSLFELAGARGVSWWIVLINVLVWMVFLTKKMARAYTGFFLAIALLLPLVLYPGTKQEAGRSLKAAVVQGNFKQEIKWEDSLLDETLNTYLSLTQMAVEKGAQLVVWPETAVPSYYQAEPKIIERLRSYTADRDIHLIFGSPGYEISGRQVNLYNRVYHLSPDRREEFYDKVVLVPFGEYIPLGHLLPIIDKIVPGEGEFARGSWDVPFGTPVPSGALICFEVSIASLARREVYDGSLMLINVTNDAWFGRSWGPYQHLALAAVRAKENRVPVLRAANTGISSIIDRNGRVVRSIPLEERGVIVVDIVTGAEKTLYTRFGDWIVILSAAVLSVYFLVILIVWRSPKWTK